MLGAIVTLLAGLVLLTVGADRLVVSAARLSRAWGVSPVLIGAVIVGLGTSAPELSVTISAAIDDSLGIAIGNVVGSNLANVTLALGAAALFAPLATGLEVLRREGVLMFVSVLALAIVLWDEQIGFLEGLALLIGMVAALYLLYAWAKEGEPPEEVQEMLEGPTRSKTREGLFGLVALVVILVGAELLVDGAGRLAEIAGLSMTFVGLIIVAIGTSLPELATALAAARRRETELVIGNVLGSNLFNSLVVAGAAGVAGPGSVADELLIPSVVLMVIAAVLAGVFAFTARRVQRSEGLILLGAFVAYVVFASVTGASA